MPARDPYPRRAQRRFGRQNLSAVQDLDSLTVARKNLHVVDPGVQAPLGAIEKENAPARWPSFSRSLFPHGTSDTHVIAA
jgi:hypothetical protein